MTAAPALRELFVRRGGPNSDVRLTFSVSPRMYSLGWAVLLLLANLSVLQETSVVLRAIGGILLFGVLPGTALVGALFRADEISTLERVSFGLGTSIILSTLATWFYSMAPGRMTAGGLLGVLDIVCATIATIAWVRRRRDNASLQIGFSAWTAAAIMLIALAALVSFLWLDYSELEGDEIVVVDDAFAMIMGDKTAIYRLAKGPAQTLLVAQFELFGSTLNEGFLRVPFAAAGVAAAGAWLLLSRKILGRWPALLALIWLLLDGLLMSKARFIQYTILIYLLDILAIYALLMAYHIASASLRLRYQLLASFFAGFGLFSHYTMAFVAPALVVIWLAGEANTFRRRTTWLRAALMAALALVISAPFYWLMLTQGHAAGKVSGYYLGYRIGQGPFNSIPWFATFMRFYESPSWFIAVAAGLVAGAGVVFIRTRRKQPVVAVLLAMAIAGTVGSALIPGVEIGGINLSFIPWALLGIALCLTRVITPVSRSLALWALAAFCVPLFWMQVPSDHFSSVALPLILLSLVALRAVFGSDRPARRFLTRPLVRAGLAATGTLLVVLGAGYVFVVIVSHTPEYAALYPDRLPRMFAWFAADTPPDNKYATPHNNGWRTVAVLYDQGILRGEYRTNEFVVISEWYRAKLWSPPVPQPRYYFAVVHPQVPLLATDVPADLTQTHLLLGQVTVDGEARILIYQRRDGSGNNTPTAPLSFSAETYDSEWRDLTRLGRFIAYRERQRDDTAFYSLAHFLELNAKESDALVFDDSLGRGLLGQFYGADRPYLSSAEDVTFSPYRRVWGVYWGSPDRKVERALEENACPASSQWFGNVRLALNGVGIIAAPITMNARLGDAARLESYGISEAPVLAGDVLCVRLDWNVIAPTAGRLKLFLHLVGADGKLVAQADSEPQAGFKPSTDWVVGERIADRVGIALPPLFVPGNYRLVGGLYDAQSGIRELALAADGSRYRDDAVDFGMVTIH